MKKLKWWIEIFHKLTIIIEDNFKDIPDYFARLNKYNDLSTELSELKKAFKMQYAKDKKLRADYKKYMSQNLDFCFFANALVSTPDMRKFDSSNKYMPFISYIYQILIWEFSQHFGITLPKSRDIGASYTLNIGAAMLLCEGETLSALYLSKTENDVDITGDRLQTNMGRIRQIIENTAIYDLRKFEINKYLNIFKDEKCGIKGSSTTATAGTGGRFQYAFIDESGVIKNLEQILQSITFSANRTHMIGTLKPAMDKSFRKAIKDAYKINIDKYIEMYKNLIIENDYDYRKTIDFIIADLKKEVPTGKNITFTITYKHHPLKKGFCNYHAIECNRLLNDPVAIAHELEADINAGSPDRSFYQCQNDFFINPAEKYGQVIFGIDPGSSKTAACVPIYKTNSGYFVDKFIMFDVGGIENFLIQLKKKYNPKVVYVEKSAYAYQSAGYGWFVMLSKYFENVVTVDNQHQETQLLIVNKVFSDKKITLHEDNKEWAMNYIAGAKYSDVKQKEISHPAEAFICAIYQENFHLINDTSGRFI